MNAYRSGPEFRVGEGSISGWISVLLGALSVLGVLCFHFPDFLTTPQLRQAYTADQMRYLLGAGMMFSVAFGLITFVLNRHKLMGAIGITLTLLALWAGGASVQVGPRYAAPGYIGLDWFILDLMLSAMLFIFLEKMWPHMREQAILRPDWWHDLPVFPAESSSDRDIRVRRHDVRADVFLLGDQPRHSADGVVAALGGAIRHGDRAGTISSSTRSTAPCTKSNGSGRSTPCITRSSTWTGWPVRACIFWNRWSRARWCWCQRSSSGSPRNR